MTKYPFLKNNLQIYQDSTLYNIQFTTTLLSPIAKNISLPYLEYESVESTSYKCKSEKYKWDQYESDADETIDETK
ncbi:18204_t:CDS:2 [Racocetra fulgida]|uniref:18204_t:CDS:1 n=1 Tax=Racocetra fulgida TaxID=60492 RepID=A0A9N9F0D0_9GLOM|nr:18204_t:CDS:2 [Racocetra fulgida]